ncbi:hypothetical protein [Streptomyces sp. NPDC048603]
MPEPRALRDTIERILNGFLDRLDDELPVDAGGLADDIARAIERS